MAGAKQTDETPDGVRLGIPKGKSILLKNRKFL